MIRIEKHEHEKGKQETGDDLGEHVEPAVFGVELEKLVGVHRVGDESALILVNHFIKIYVFFALCFLFLRLRLLWQLWLRLNLISIILMLGSLSLLLTIRFVLLGSLCRACCFRSICATCSFCSTLVG